MAGEVKRQSSSGTCGVLIGKKAIASYLNISRDTFYEFIRLGMPAAVINGRWYAHRENIEQWFQIVTRKRAGKTEMVGDPE